LAARDIERSVSSLPLLATSSEYPERMNSLTDPLEDSKAEFVDDPVAAPVEMSSLRDVGLGEPLSTDVLSGVSTVGIRDIQAVSTLDTQSTSRLSRLDTQAMSRVSPVDAQGAQKGSVLDISTQQSNENSILDNSREVPSRLSLQASELPDRMHNHGTEDLAGEASIEPMDVSVLVGEYGGNRHLTREISMPNEISTIQVDQVEEATILDINEPDDLFVTDRKAEYSYSSDELFEIKQSFVCYYRRVI
jgi:hypothetical protein